MPAPAPGAGPAGAAAGRFSLLSGFPSSQRLELKNSIFPFSGASAPARSREQSREAPTLPAAALAAAKDALTALARTGQRTSGTDLPAHAVFSRPRRCWRLHVTSLLCTNPVWKKGKIKQHGRCLATRGFGPQPKVPQTLYTSLCVQGVQRKSPGTVFVQKAEEDEGAEERAGSYSSLSSRTLAPATGQSPGLLAGHNVSHRQHQMQTRRSSPAVSLRGLQTPLSWLFFTRRLASGSASPVAWQKSDFSAPDVTRPRAAGCQMAGGKAHAWASSPNLLTVRANPLPS